MKTNYIQKIILPLLIIFMGVTVHAQQLQWEWARQGLGTGGGTVAGMLSDSLGNNYIAGSFADSVRFGETLLTAQGQNDIFLVKYDKEGNVRWAVSAGSESDDYPGTLAMSPGGNIYMAGMSGKKALFGGQTSGEKKQNLFVAQYTDEGECRWITSWPARPGDYITAMVADSLGNVYCGGYFEKKMEVDASHSVSSAGKSDAFVALFNSKGNLQWLNAWGGKGSDRITSLQLSGEQLAVAGICQSSVKIAGNTTAPANGAAQMAVVVRYNSEGDVLTTHKVAEGANLHVASIRPLSDGTIAVGGSFSDSLLLESQLLRSYGDHDIFIALLDSSGAMQWQQQVGSYGFDKLYDILEHPSGIVATGIYSGTLFVGNDTTTFQSRYADLFNLALDKEGKQQWISATRGRTEQYPSALTQDAKGNIFVAGAFRDTLRIRRTELAAPKGLYNVFFAKLHYCEASQISFLCDTVFTEGTTLPLKVEGNYTTYRWDRGESTGAVYPVRCSGTYHIMVTDSLNCVYRDSISVRQTPTVPVLQIRAEEKNLLPINSQIIFQKFFLWKEDEWLSEC